MGRSYILITSGRERLNTLHLSFAGSESLGTTVHESSNTRLHQCLSGLYIF